MKIRNIEYQVHKIELEEPYQIAYETISHCENVILKLITDKGLTGYGLAAPDKEITKESAGDVTNTIEQVIITLLKNQDVFRISYWLEELKKTDIAGPSARAMVDMALHDLLAKKAGLPLYKVLGGYRESIKTSVTIGIKPLDETLEMAGKYFASGFSILKIKGGLNLEEDIEKVYKIRKLLGPSLVIRFDANQGYTAREALEFVNRTKNAGLEILEQPTKKDEIELLREVTEKSSIPVMADESVRSLSDAIHFVKHDAIDMINVKLQKVGGILEAAHINSVAKSAGLEVMVSCLDECSLGIAAGLHFALSRPNVELADLDGHMDMLNDPYNGLFTIENGTMKPNCSKPGLGI